MHKPQNHMPFINKQLVFTKLKKIIIAKKELKYEEFFNTISPKIANTNHWRVPESSRRLSDVRGERHHRTRT